jgi:hypothetical protein
MDWSQLSEVSEAYGALAVLFSAAAFLGAIVSILYQAKQTRAMNEEIRSSIHKELTLHSIEDETLMHCWQPPSEPCTLAQARQHMFCNLIYRLWLADYVVGRTTLEATRIVLTNHFAGEVARRHWRIMGRQWISWAKANANRRDREFVALTQQVYETAVAAGPPTEENSYFLPAQS